MLKLILLLAQSKFTTKYNKVVDSESTHEILTSKLEEAAQKTEDQKAGKLSKSSAKKKKAFLIINSLKALTGRQQI